MKNSASCTRRRLERGHDDERRAPVVRAARVDRVGPLDEAVVHRLEQDEELGDVLEELRAEDAVGHRGRRASTAAVMHAATAVRHGEPAQQPAAEEVGHALRRLEEVDGVPGRRRVDDDQVVACPTRGSRTAAPSRCSRGSARTAGDVLVQRVGEDARRGSARRARGGARGRPTTAWCRASPPTARRAGSTPAAANASARHPRLDVAERLEAERVGQALAGSTVSTSTLPPRWTAAIGRGRRRGRRLADAARAAGDDDLLGREQLLERAGGSAVGAPRAISSPSSSPSASATWLRGAQRRGARVNSYGHVQQRQRRGEPSRSRVEVRGARCGAASPRARRRRARRRTGADRGVGEHRLGARARAARSNTSSSPRPNSSGSTRFTTTAARSTLVSCAMRPASSIVSLTGISSGVGDDHHAGARRVARGCRASTASARGPGRPAPAR